MHNGQVTHAEAPAKADWWKEVDSLLMLLFPPKLLIPPTL